MASSALLSASSSSSDDAHEDDALIRATDGPASEPAVRARAAAAACAAAANALRKLMDGAVGGAEMMAIDVVFFLVERFVARTVVTPQKYIESL